MNPIQRLAHVGEREMACFQLCWFVQLTNDINWADPSYHMLALLTNKYITLFRNHPEISFHHFLEFQVSISF